ncbi:MAG: helix-turn-helix transcriptional regulator [Anaerolineaceae bacterium]|nr:helix-turn-helix transcriptional regulator [Anaerolineaceae bacterium]
MKTISEWINEELVRSRMTQAELARKSKISTAQIARAANGTRGLSEENIKKIAGAFGVSPVQAFREIGLLPQVDKDTERDEELLHLFHQMTIEKREDLLFYAEFLLKK